MVNTSINEHLAQKGEAISKMKQDIGGSDQTLIAPSLDSKEVFPLFSPLARTKPPASAAKIKKSVSRMFEGKLLLPRPLPKNNQPASGVLDINILLPHKEALKDLKHVVHFTQFQNSESTFLSNGESFKIMKHNLNQTEPSHIYLEVLDSQFDYKNISRVFDSAKDSQSVAPFINPFFQPLDEKHLESSYLVGSYDLGSDVHARPVNFGLHNRPGL